MHQHFRTAIGPGRPGGGGDIREARLRQAVRADRLEEAVIAQVVVDDPPDLLAERRGAARAGRGRPVCIGGEAGDSDTEILPVALVRDGEGQAAFVGFALRGRGALDLAVWRRRRAEVLRGQRPRYDRGEKKGGDGHRLFHRDKFLSKRAPRIDFHAL